MTDPQAGAQDELAGGTLPVESEAYADYLYSLGFTSAEVSATLKALIYGERSGIPSHGLRRICGGFIGRAVADGLCEPGVAPVELGSPDVLRRFDARGAIGYYAFDKILTDVARERRSFLLHIANLYPTNALGQQAELLGAAGYICFIASRSPARVTAPTGDRPVAAAAPVVGTNAQAWGYPGPAGRPVVFDSSFASLTNGDILAGESGLLRTLDPAACLSEEFEHAARWSDVIRDGKFNGLIRPFGGTKDYKGFGILLVPEILHWLGRAEAPGSTFVMALRPPDDQEFARARDAFESRFLASMRFADGGGPRLPGAGRRASRMSTSTREVLSRFADQVPAVPAQTRRLLRTRLSPAVPGIGAPSGRSIPPGLPAAGLLTELTRLGSARVPAVWRPGDATALAPATAAFADADAALSQLGWADHDGRSLRTAFVASLIATAPQVSWVLDADDGCPRAVCPALVLTRDSTRADMLTRRFPGSLIGLLTDPGTGHTPGGASFDVVARREDDRSLTLVPAPPGRSSNTGPAPELPGTPDGHEARRLARIREVIETASAAVDLGVPPDALLALATGRKPPGTAFFDTWAAQGYELPSLAQHSLLLDACIAKVRFGPEHRVLDVGCGDGKLAVRLPATAELDLLDPSQEMLDRIPAASVRARSVRRLRGCLRELPPDRYDRIVAVMSLHHYPHDEIAAALADCRARLEPGGIMYLGETFLDTRELDRPEVIDRICDVYLRKIVNAARQGCTGHAIKDVEIMGRILRGDGEYMRTRRQWKQLLQDAGIPVFEDATTSPDIMYGYLLGVAE